MFQQNCNRKLLSYVSCVLFEIVGVIMGFKPVLAQRYGSLLTFWRFTNRIIIIIIIMPVVSSTLLASVKLLNVFFTWFVVTEVIFVTSKQL